MRDDVIFDTSGKQAKGSKDKAPGAAERANLPLREETATDIPSMAHLIFQEPSSRRPEPGHLC
ncbi:MAG: hypothetical protein EPN75_14235 [Beijerinckiaceae bacterium]|nr:MAG: hypothetical protein EPN75_14235 [Beijerinckiaceae bacterium]